MAKPLLIEKRQEIQALLRRRFSDDKLFIGSAPSTKAAHEIFEQVPYDIVIWNNNEISSDILKPLESLKDVDIYDTSQDGGKSFLRKNSEGLAGSFAWMLSNRNRNHKRAAGGMRENP